MSKRACGANFGGDEERYGKANDPSSMESDKPVRATAAQLAKRKIAQVKSSGRRSASPAVSTAPVGAANSQFQVPTQGGFNFSFGNTNSSFGQQPQQNGSPAPVFGSANATQQNNTNSFARANTPSFTTSFNSTPAQPQQNGFTPSTSFSFSQPQAQQQQQPSSTSFQFGQTQSNGTTPNLGSSSLFKSFGQQNQQSGQNGASFQFGASQDPKPANGSFMFGQQPQANNDKAATSGSSNVFGSLNQSAQQNGDKPLFGVDTQSKSFNSGASENSTLFSNLGQKPLSNVDKPAAEAPTSSSSIFSSLQTPKFSGSSVFTSEPQVQTNGDRTEAPPQTSSTSLFSNLGQTQPNGTQTPADTTRTPSQKAFTSFGQTPATQIKAPLFGSLQSEQQTPKTSNIFANISNQTPITDVQQDTSMTTPDQTPRKTSGVTTTAQPESVDGPVAPSTTTQSRSLFDRIDNAEVERLHGKSLGSSTTLQPVEQSKETASSSFFTATKKPGTFGLLAQSSIPNPTPSWSAQAFTPKSTTTSAPEPPKTAPVKSTFEPTQLPPPTVGIFGGNRETFPSKPVEATAASTQNPGSLTIQQRKKLRKLNSGLLKHLNSANLERDWSAVLRFCLSESSRICPSDAEKPKPATSAPNIFGKLSEIAPVQKRRLVEDDDVTEQAPTTEKRVKMNEPMSYPKLPETASKTARLFAASLHDPDDTPSVSKGAFTPISKPAMSQKPDDTPSVAKVGFTPAIGATADSAVAKTSSGTKPTFSFSNSTTPKASSGFVPSFSTTQSTTAKPSLGFTPSFSSLSSNADMFAAFGKAAKAQEDKDRSKRKAEEYDSDDETPEEWAKRDEEEQERKRAKIAEAASSATGFTFKDPGTKSSNLTETPKAQPKSLFDRITPASPPKTAPSKPSMFATGTPSLSTNWGNQPPATVVHKSTSNIFGNPQAETNKPKSNMFGFLSDKGSASQHGEEVEKELGVGDKTFKPDTPIKFGATTASTPSVAPQTGATKFTGLFGSSTPPNGPTVGSVASTTKLAPPLTGFSIGAGLKSSSLDASRSNTPALTTDGEGSTATGADDADGEEPSLPQVEDQTELQADEKKENVVLFELGSTKFALCKKFEDRQGTKEWVSKGKGRLYILKNKKTGKARILVKIAPYGKAAMNYEPISGMTYKVMAGTGKMVSGSFIDHIHAKEPKLGQFLITVKEPKDAENIAKILTDEASE